LIRCASRRSRLLITGVRWPGTLWAIEFIAAANGNAISIVAMVKNFFIDFLSCPQSGLIDKINALHRQKSVQHETGYRTERGRDCVKTQRVTNTLKAFANSSPGFALKPWVQKTA
jgi:hypothetical protein